MQARLESIRQDLRKRAIDAVDDGIVAGANAMKNNIATRPTTWMAENRGKTGRIDSGNMLDAVSYELREEGDVIVGEWGWITQEAKYFLTQENGGPNTFTGGEIEPMNAMRDSVLPAHEAMLRKFGSR